MISVPLFDLQVPGRTFRPKPLVYDLVARFTMEWNPSAREKRAFIQPIRYYPERFAGGNAQFGRNHRGLPGSVVLLRRNHSQAPGLVGAVRDSTQSRKSEPAEHPTR